MKKKREKIGKNWLEEGGQDGDKDLAGIIRWKTRRGLVEKNAFDRRYWKSNITQLTF